MSFQVFLVGWSVCFGRSWRREGGCLRRRTKKGKKKTSIIEQMTKWTQTGQNSVLINFRLWVPENC